MDVMRVSLLKIALLLGVTCLASVATGCGGGPIVIKGRVVDARGTPIYKAAIHTRPDTDDILSNSRGFFRLDRSITEDGRTAPIKAGVYKLAIRKAGFKDRELTIKVKGGNYRVKDLVLEERKAEFEDTAPEPGVEKKISPDDTSAPKQGY